MKSEEIEYDIKIGEKIRIFRVIKKISQRQLADYLFLSKQIISNIEIGKRKVSAFEIVKIAEYFDLEMEVFSSKKKINFEVVDI